MTKTNKSKWGIKKPSIKIAQLLVDHIRAAGRQINRFLIQDMNPAHGRL